MILINLVDRVVSYFKPEAGMKRAAARGVIDVLNGYDQGGASHQKKSMRGWITSAVSPKEDIDRSLETLRARSRDLFMNSPIGSGALKTARTNVIGPGLKLKSRIDAERLGLSDEAADAWKRNTESEFALWAESKHSDALRMNDFYDQQGIAFLGMLMNGDAFAIFRRVEREPWMPYGLRLHVIESDRICNPQSTGYLGDNVESKNTINGNEIVSGVEIDGQGATVAYHISNTYPSAIGYESTKPRKWVRVEAYGAKTGQPNVLHLMDAERAEQRRGVPFLAPVIESLKQITRYTEAELMASVIAGMFTVFIKSAGPSSEMPLGTMVDPDQQVARSDPNAYEMGAGAINVLEQGEEVQIANPGRPNSQFDPFVSSLCRYIGAALEIPQELLLKSFQSSYSASRAALLEAWKMFRMRRQWTAKEFCQPVYEEWLTEAVAIGRIRAPGFFNDPAIKRAWCKAEWNGPAPGQLDPVKEVSAAEKRIANGLSTREREAIETNGSDFESNIQQQKRENEILKDAGINPYPGSPPDPVDSEKEVRKENGEEDQA